MKKTTYAVFGLGRYGMSVAKELNKNGMEVLAVDIDEDIINDAATELPICKCADITDAEVINQLGIANIDVVIVAMAGNLEASILAVTLCKDVGVKTVIAKCSNEIHQRILQKVGADQVVFPEKDSGIRLAKNLLSSGFVDMVDLSDDVAIVELDVPNKWIGENLVSLNLRKKYEINVIAIKKDSSISINIVPNEKLEQGMKLVVMAHKNKMEKLMKIVR